MAVVGENWVLVENRPLGRLGHRWEKIILMNIKEVSWRWSGFIGLRIRTAGSVVYTVKNLRFPLMQGVS